MEDTAAIEARTTSSETRCPNCGISAAGDYCPNCGQAKAELVPALVQWLVDVLDDLFFVNRSVPLSLGLLLGRPGELTSEWRNGRRARYVHPFRIYLLCASTFFLLAPLIGSSGGLLPSVVTGAAEAHTDGAPFDDAFLATVLNWWPPLLLVVMVPVAAALLAMVLRARHRRFLEHLVFSLHFHSVVFIYLVAALPLTWIPDSSPASWLQALPYQAALVYAALAIRRNYALGAGKAAIATAGAAALYFLGVGVALGALTSILLRSQ